MKRTFVLLGLLAMATATIAWAEDAGQGKAPAGSTVKTTTTTQTTTPPATPSGAMNAAPGAAATEHRAYTPGTLTWVDAPTSLPKGAKMAVVQGDPAAPGLFTMRVKLPARYRVPPHFHPADEHVTVVSGELMMALGDTFDESKGHALPAGAFSIMPKGMHHYAWTKVETEFQVHGIGPWGITYLNPQDDPRNAKQAAK